ncbi:Golgi transport complex subunit 5-domain-containing protein [Cytidiella melzeri]|nr:Golgi transport complex subunit 5-domain-containing protein [Cytidiella melzeri]
MYNGRFCTGPLPGMSDYAVFSLPEFDPNEYANAVLAGEAYPHPTGGPSSTGTNKTIAASNGISSALRLNGSRSGTDAEDISVAISKLTYNIEDVEKQLKTVVTVHHEDLLVQAAGVTELEGSLSSVRGGLQELDVSLDKLRAKIRTPYQILSTHVTRLERLQQASDILRRTSRFVVLTKRLQMQLSEMDRAGDIAFSASESKTIASGSKSSDLTNGDGGRKSTDSLSTLAGTVVGSLEEDDKERVIAKAALTIAELVSLMEPPATSADLSTPTSGTEHVPLSSVKIVSTYLSYVESARERVTYDMEQMVINGLRTRNRSLLASSLQTAHNLRVLPDLVQNLVSDLSDAVEARIRYAFDLTRLAKEVTAKDPQAPASSNPLYKSRFRTEPTNVTAPQWQAVLWSSLENLIEEMADCCIKVYTLEKVLILKKDAVSQVVFLDEAMKVIENKPSATFWSSLGQSLEKQIRDATKASSFLQQTLSSNYPRLLRLFHSFFAKIAVHTDTVYTQAYQSPETVLVLRALMTFESLYLSRASNRLNEAISQAFAAGSRGPPGQAEGINIARAIANELDSAKFDPLLVKAAARYTSTSMESLVSRADNLAARERAAVSLSGPVATPPQVLNGQLATCLWHCWSRLDKLQEEYPDPVMSILKTGISNAHRSFERIVDPLAAAIRRELSAMIAKLHKQDFSDNVDPMSAMGGGASAYMKDLCEKLTFIKAEVLSQFNIPVFSRGWITSIVQYVMKNFVLHASIVKPLGETGKLQLTSDMTELEFALSAFMSDKAQNKRGANWGSVQDEYRCLRAMRPLLFLENSLLASPKHTASLPPLIVLHHVLVRSPIPLPHALHGWAEAEYVRWVNEHNEEEAWSLVESDLSHWEQIAAAEGTDTAEAAQYVQIARSILVHAKNASS